MASVAPEDVSRALAAEVKERREKAGLTQAQMAKLAGFRWITSYQRLEYHDRVINTIQLTAIGNVLGIYPDELLRVARIRAGAGDFPQPPGAGGAFGLG